MAGASLDIQLQISNAAEVKAAFESLQSRLADLTPVFQDIGEAMLNRTRERFNSQTAPDGTPWRALSPAYALVKKQNFRSIRVGHSIRILRASFDAWLEEERL